MSHQTLHYSQQPAWYRDAMRRAVQRLRRVSIYLCVLLACYTASYLCLTVFGRFEPGALDVNGVMFYKWVPAGFTSNFKHRWSLYYLYFPLWHADDHCWHRPDDARTGKYPTSMPTNAAEWARWRR